VRHTLQDAGKVLQDRRSAPVGYARNVQSVILVTGW